MTNIEKISECIEAWPNGICDKCIGLVTAVRPHQQVVQVCNKLAERSEAGRGSGTCSRCDGRRLVNAPKSNKPFTNVSAVGTSQPITDDELDGLRRLLIARLKTIDSGSRGSEGFSAQVVRLRNEGKLPGNVASLM